MDDQITFAASLLRQVAKAVESLTEDEKSVLASGEATLRLSVETKTRPRRVQPSIGEIDTSALHERLASCESREEAERIIKEMSLTKASLQQITKAFELPNQKDDTTSKLIERIVESTVGFRLRSQAIQGKVEPIASSKESQQGAQPEPGYLGRSDMNKIT